MPETVRETEENNIHSKLVPQVHNKILTKIEKLLNMWLENMVHNHVSVDGNIL